MIKIIKTEYATEFSPIVRSVHFKDADFFDFTDGTLTEKDFAKSFVEHVGEFGNVTKVHDDGKYISISYDRFNRGILEIYPEPPPVPEKKRVTKNLESLVKYANIRGFRMTLKQNDNYSWYCVMFDNNNENIFISKDDFTTPYQAAKAVLEDAGLFKC